MAFDAEFTELMYLNVPIPTNHAFLGNGRKYAARRACLGPYHIFPMDFNKGL
jgi:hypothetical protein